MKRPLLLLLISGALLFNAAGEGKKETPAKEGTGSLTLFAAASTTDLVEEIGGIFTEETGIQVKVNPASSGTLAKQIEEGAPADVFISASAKWMTYVEDLGAARESTPYLLNRLVLIAPAGGGTPVAEIDRSLDFPASFEGRLSIGDPAHVPAGQYAMDALTYYGWDRALEARLLPGADVRGALAVVEKGETDRGIVYETDAAKSEKVTIVGVFPEESHAPIKYYAALLKESTPEGEEFYRFLTESDRVGDICRKYGFTPAGEE